MPHWTMRCLDLQGKACDVRLLDALTPETSALLGPLSVVICAGTWRPQLLDVVGDPAADGEVCLRLLLSPLPSAVVPVLRVLEEPGTQDFWLAVQDDDECTLDTIVHPATAAHK